MILPELLSPAGDLDRVHTALLYGADAVYLAGRLFGMRAKSVSFSDADLEKAIGLIHERGKKVYITCNVLPREKELELVPDYFAFLQDLGADALILADLGLLRMAERYAPKCARHVSTQLGVLNSETASFLYELGADTVVLARECSLEEIRAIREHSPAALRLEAFVHGAMCVSFSGRCLLSNYLTGRDSNHGECAQPCRWKYHLVEETRPGKYMEISEDGGTFILNSEDLCMIEHLAELREAGIDSFKIEGRMKSAYYTGAVTNAYPPIAWHWMPCEGARRRLSVRFRSARPSATVHTVPGSTMASRSSIIRILSIIPRRRSWPWSMTAMKTKRRCSGSATKSKQETAWSSCFREPAEFPLPRRSFGMKAGSRSPIPGTQRCSSGCRFRKLPRPIPSSEPREAPAVDCETKKIGNDIFIV